MAAIDYETDPRPYAYLLRDFARRANGGRVAGSRERAAAELRTAPTTLAGWMAGRPCPHEAAMRRLMTFISAGFAA